MKKKILFSPLIVIVLIIVAGVSLAGAAILLGGGGNSENVSLQKGLVGWWKMDGNAKDSTPNQNDGVVTVATLINDRKGEAQKAYNFTGGTDKITVPNSPSLDITGNQITISGWINWQGTAGGGGGNGRFVDRENGGGYMIFINDTRTISYRWNASVTFSHTSTGTIANQGWSFITFTYDGANTRIYINGVLDKTSAETTTFGSIKQPLVIGNLSDNSRALDAYLDDIRIYNRPLSQTEITALYQEYNPGIKVSTLQGGLLGWWKMDGNFKDSTPNGNNGVSSGTTSATLTTDRKGEVSRAYSFNGDSDGMVTPGTTVFDTASMSATMWFTLTSDPNCDGNNNYRLLIGKVGAGVTDNTLNGWDVVLEESKSVQFDVGYNGATHRTGGINVGMALNVPIFLTFTYNNMTGDEKIYANAVIKKTQANAAGSIAPNGQGLKIAKGVNGFCPNAQGFTPGIFDDVRVYDHALSQTEVTALYEEYDSKIQVSNLQRGLVGNWSFDNGNAKDMTPNENKGTVNGATLTTDRKGQVNKAYNFGTSKYITVPDSTSLHVASKMSVSAWVNIMDGNGTDDNSERTVVRKEHSFFMRLNPANETPRFACFTINGGVAENRTATSTSSGWVNYVCTYDASGGSNNLKLYKNGVLASQATKTGNIDMGTDTLAIGARNDGSFPWLGTIDDVRIYNRVLSQAEITALYESY